MHHQGCLRQALCQVELLIGPWDLLFYWMIRKQLNCEAMRVAEPLVLWLNVETQGMPVEVGIPNVYVCTVLMLGFFQVFHREDIGSKC